MSDICLVSDKSVQAVDAFGVRREEFESKKIGNKLVQQVCIHSCNSAKCQLKALKEGQWKIPY